MNSSAEYFVRLVKEKRIRLDLEQGRAWRVSKGVELAKAKPGSPVYRTVGWVDEKTKKSRSLPLHRLIWSAAYDAIPPEGISVTFINGNIQDCRIQNLKAVLRSEFAREVSQKFVNPVVFEDEAVVRLRKLFATEKRATLSFAADYLHVDIGALSRAVTGVTYSHVKTEWDAAVLERFTVAKSKTRSASPEEIKLKAWLEQATVNKRCCERDDATT